LTNDTVRPLDGNECSDASVASTDCLERTDRRAAAYVLKANATNPGTTWTPCWSGHRGCPPHPRPHLTYWLLPSLIGVPLIWRALRRFARTAPNKSSQRSWTVGWTVEVAGLRSERSQTWQQSCLAATTAARVDKRR